MQQDILQTIHQAEAQADQIAVEAQREARTVVKAVEDACAFAERDAAADIRREARHAVESARVLTQDELNASDIRAATERERARRAALERLPAAAQLVFERVVRNGHR